MKKLLSLLTMLVCSIGAVAQEVWPWTVSHADEAASDRTVIFADFTILSGTPYQGNFTLGAFVLTQENGAECRWTSDDNGQSMRTYANGQTTERFLQIEVPGNYGQVSDVDCPIIFFARDNSTGHIYELSRTEITGTTEQAIDLTWGEAKTYGSASGPRIQLHLENPTTLSIPEFDLIVNEKVNLFSKVVTDPHTGCAIPINVDWVLDGITDEAEILSPYYLKGLKPVKGATVKMVSKVDNTVLASGTFNVLQHATAISIVTSEIAVEKDDANQLTNFMLNQLSNKAYSLTPADANDQVYWEVSSEYIQEIPDANNGPTQYKPIKAGTTTISPYFMLNNEKVYPTSPASITVNISVVATDITLNWPSGVTFKCNVGDDICQRIKSIVKISPDEATIRDFIIDAQDEGYLSFNSDATSVIAQKAGNTSIMITHPEAGEVELQIEIFNPAKTVAATNNPMPFSESATKTTVGDAIANNVTWEPTGSEVNGTITTTDGWGTGSMTPNGSHFTIGDDKTLTGDHVITATVSWNDYSNYDGTEATITTASASCTFTVSFYKELAGFTITVSPDAGDPTQGTITLEPVPAEAEIGSLANDFTMSLVAEQYGNWAVATLTPTTPALSYTYTTALPGSFVFKVHKNGEADDVYFAQQSFEVPALVQLTSGWQWKSHTYGNVAGNELQALFGKDLIEARTQEDLLYNDKNWGYYGSMNQTGISQSQMYKVNINFAVNSYITNGFPREDGTLTLQPGWNWVGSPYFYDRKIENFLLKPSSGMVIISKNNGSAEYGVNGWQGDLKLIKKGEGYLIYNNSSADVNPQIRIELFGGMAQGDETTASARNRAIHTSVWQYDHSRFANNMTMVAEMPQLEDAEQYTIGAFVDGECRGEGFFEDGLAYITVHCNSGEQITFRLHNELTGEYYDIDQTVMSQMRVGSLKSPYKLTSVQTVTGIGSVNSNAVSSQLFDLNGRQLNSQRKGVSIQRKADGTVRKVVVR